jgi:hypothetical protein
MDANSVGQEIKMKDQDSSQQRTNETTKQNLATVTRLRSVSYPRYDLKQSEKLARAAFEMGPRHCDQDKVAQAIGYKNAQNGAFIALKASANQFGFVVGQGRYLSVAENWINVFNSDDADEARIARISAMTQPDLYKKIIQEYADRQLPASEKFARDLHLSQKYGILKDAAKIAAQVFVESANFAGILDAKGFLRRPDAVLATENTDPLKNSTVQEETEAELDSPPAQQFPHALTGKNRFPDVSEGLDRIEIRLRNGQKAYFFLPVPLPYGEKERLKQYLDLALEEGPLQQDISSGNTGP